LNARRSKSELVTTLTELKAIKAPAAAGLRQFQSGIKPQAAESQDVVTNAREVLTDFVEGGA
jgi:hypothetical protein